eukprot:scaffold38389_cov70-Phaeocystis_antarctica.AAC.6
MVQTWYFTSILNAWTLSSQLGDLRHPPERALDTGTWTHGDEEAIVARLAYALALERVVCPQE